MRTSRKKFASESEVSSTKKKRREGEGGKKGGEGGRGKEERTGVGVGYKTRGEIPEREEKKLSEKCSFGRLSSVLWFKTFCAFLPKNNVLLSKHFFIK